jgi:sirohydrochlorin cobaltochelatase
LAPPPIFAEHDRLAIVLLGHGSREQRANTEFERIADELQALWTRHAVVPAYVELAQPSLSAALTQAATLSDRIVVLPCFLFTAGHIKNDLPLELYRARQAHPGKEFLASPALGVHPAMVEAVLGRLHEAQPVKRERMVTIVVGRGSSDPDANGDFAKLARLIGEGAGQGLALPAFIGITKPSLEEALELAARTRPEEIVDEYQRWVREVIDRDHNGLLGEKLVEERRHLRPLPVVALPAYTTFTVMVRRWSTIRVV